MACLSPWACGAAKAWAKLALYAGIALVALLGVVAGRGQERTRPLRCGPSLALGGLVLLSLVQAMPLPGGLLRRIAPATAALRADLLPAAPERVAGDPAPPVPLPAPTLSQHPEMRLDAATRLAAGWALFQAVLGLRGVTRRCAASGWRSPTTPP
jgi:hypothetical protein